MLARLKGVVTQESLEPWQAWEKTDPRRHDNPRWARNTDGAAPLDPAWDTNWVFTNTEEKRRKEGMGKISDIRKIHSLYSSFFMVTLVV